MSALRVFLVDFFNALQEEGGVRPDQVLERGLESLEADIDLDAPIVPEAVQEGFTALAQLVGEITELTVFGAVRLDPLDGAEIARALLDLDCFWRMKELKTGLQVFQMAQAFLRGLFADGEESPVTEGEGDDPDTVDGVVLTQGQMNDIAIVGLLMTLEQDRATVIHEALKSRPDSQVFFKELLASLRRTYPSTPIARLSAEDVRVVIEEMDTPLTGWGKGSRAVG